MGNLEPRSNTETNQGWEGKGRGTGGQRIGWGRPAGEV